MVERVLRMHEAVGSMPTTSKYTQGFNQSGQPINLSLILSRLSLNPRAFSSVVEQSAAVFLRFSYFKKVSDRSPDQPRQSPYLVSLSCFNVLSWLPNAEKVSGSIPLSSNRLLHRNPKGCYRKVCGSNPQLSVVLFELLD